MEGHSLSGILIVDDDALMRRALMRVLRELKVPLREAPDAATALASIEQEPPALVLTDFTMPGMNGQALAEEVARRHPEIPVVVHSGNAQDVLPGRWWPDFDVTIVPKPASTELLLSVVVAALRDR